MRYLTILPMVLSSSLAYAEWTRVDTTLQVVTTVTLTVDYLQTRRGLDTGKREMNPIINKIGPEAYFPLVAVGHAVVALALPSKARTIWQGVTIGVQINAIQGNLGLVGWGMPW